MSKTIYGTPVGGSAMPKVFQLELEDGTVLEGVVAEEAPDITATANDVRKGKTVITSDGLIEGEKIIPSYHTTEESRYVPDGSAFIIPMSGLDLYDYTKLQVIICAFNSTINNSVSAEKVVILNKVYNVGSTEAIADVTKDSNEKQINLGITNDSGYPCIARIFTYKEID